MRELNGEVHGMLIDSLMVNVWIYMNYVLESNESLTQHKYFLLYESARAIKRTSAKGT